MTSSPRRTVALFRLCSAHARTVACSLVLIVGLNAFLAGCNSAPDKPEPVAVEKAAVPPAPVEPPAPAAVAPANPPDYTTTGPLVVEQQANVLAKRDGDVVSVRAELGQRVGRGQVLALLDDRSLQAAVASKAARLESLNAQVREWQAEQRGTEADMRRADFLFKSKIISEEEQEHTRSKLDQTIAEVARYKSDAAAAAADLRSAKIDIEDTRIVAPMAGVIGRRSVRNAQEVKKGDQLFWVTAEYPLHIVFTVPESAMSSFRPGAALELSTPAVPSLRQEATVMHVSPVVDPASGSIEVNGMLQHPSPLLKAGMSMKVQLAARHGRQAD